MSTKASATSSPLLVKYGTLCLQILQGTDMMVRDRAERRGKNPLKRRSSFTQRKSRLVLSGSAVTIVVRLAKWRSIASLNLNRSNCNWNEEFNFEDISTDDHLRLFCLDRLCMEGNNIFDLESDDSLRASHGFIGEVSIPINRLPENESIEQWYPLLLNENNFAERSALRLSLAFTIENFTISPTRRSMTEGMVSDSNARLSFGLDDVFLAKSDSPNSTCSTSSTLPAGVIDYAVFVGPNCFKVHDDSSEVPSVADHHTVSVLARYPQENHSGFPLPTKIEWFCFPNGIEILQCEQKPRPRLFTFLLAGGQNGLCHSYGICLIMYHSTCDCCKICKNIHDNSNTWIASCMCFISRLPLIQDIAKCLMAISSEFLSSCNILNKKRVSKAGLVGDCIFQLTREIPKPLRGKFGVRFQICNLIVVCKLPLAHAKQPLPSPKKSGIRLSLNLSSPLNITFPRSAYPLSILFKAFNVKTIVHLVALTLFEYRIVLHSNQISMLCPIAECICCLLFPFRWQHPYVPVLPRVLTEYLQAPLPYILGVHSSWVEELLESNKPEHLVLVDIDRGVVKLTEWAPPLPKKMSMLLVSRLNDLLYPSINEFDDVNYPASPVSVARENYSKDCSLSDKTWDFWDHSLENRIRLEFIFFISSILKGYRDCLFFVNQTLPVFNKQRFFNAYASAESAPFLTKLLSTQTFESFLETHNSRELMPFHSIYNHFRRGKQELWLENSPLLSSCYSFENENQPILEIPKIPDSRFIAEEIENRCKTCGETSVQTIFLALSTLNSNSTKDILPSIWGCDEVSKILGLEHDFLKNKEVESISRNPSLASPVVKNFKERQLSLEKEDIEHCLQKCMTTIFSTDEILLEEDLLACELCFTSQYARDFFVMILRQPASRTTEDEYNMDDDGSMSFMAWNSLSGNCRCLCDPGFFALSKLANAMLQHCDINKDFANASYLLQLATQYYRVVGEKKEITQGFEKKEYLQASIYQQPICRSLDMWRHAFCCNIDLAVKLANRNGEEFMDSSQFPYELVTDEMFFSQVGSLAFDMLSVKVPKDKVHIFVRVMCSTFNRNSEIHETLDRLVDNVNRAISMSCMTETSTNSLSMSSEKDLVNDLSTRTYSTSSNYDLDSVIRRKISLSSQPPSLRRYSPNKESNPTENGEQLIFESNCKQYKGHVGPVLCVAACSSYVVTGGIDGLVKVWKNEGKGLISEFGIADEHVAPVTCLDIRGKLMVSGSVDCSLQVWKLNDVSRRSFVLYPFFRSSSSRSSISSSGLIEKKKTLLGHKKAINCMSFGKQISSKHFIFASGSQDQTVGLWDSRNEICRGFLRGGHSGEVSCVEFALSHDFLVSGSKNGKDNLLMWDINTLTLKMKLKGHSRGIGVVEVHGDQIVSGSNDRSIKVWDIRSRNSCVQSLIGHNAPITCLSLGVSDPLICSGSSDSVIKIWDLRFLSDRHTKSSMNDEKRHPFNLIGHQSGITCLERDFTRLISGSEDSSIRVWDIQKGKCVEVWNGHKGGVTCLARNDTTVFSGSWDTSLMQWNTEKNLNR